MRMILVIVMVLIAVMMLAMKANAESCPDMSGHFQNKTLGMTSDIQIAQNGCVSGVITMVVPPIAARAMGVMPYMHLETPLDGVVRDVPPPPNSPYEKDRASARFVGNVAVILVYETFQDGSKKATSIQALMNGSNLLELYKSDLDDQGNTSNTLHFEFGRVP